MCKDILNNLVHFFYLWLRPSPIQQNFVTCTQDNHLYPHPTVFSVVCVRLSCLQFQFQTGCLNIFKNKYSQAEYSICNFKFITLISTYIIISLKYQWQMQTLSQGGGGGGCYACPAHFSTFCDFFFVFNQKQEGALPLPQICH